MGIDDGAARLFIGRSLADPFRSCEEGARTRHFDRSFCLPSPPCARLRALGTGDRPDAQGRPLRMVGVELDITDRKQAEAETRLIVERLALATDAASIGIWEWDLRTDRWHATPTYFRMLGYDPEEGFGDRERWLGLLHPDDRATVGGKIGTVLAGSSAHYGYEARLRHADGAYRSGGFAFCNDARTDPALAPWRDEAIKCGYNSLAAFALKAAGKPVGIFVVYGDRPGYFDQEELRLLNAVAENLSFAIESHEQDQRRMRAEAALRANEANMAAAQRIARFGSWELDLENRDAINANPLRWSDEMFRIVQESLTNVIRHAGANSVEVALGAHGVNLRLTVRDDGRGITPKEQADPRSIGLLGMRERAMLLGGETEIAPPQAAAPL